MEGLAADRRLHIYRVPGHKRIAGNEIVDKITKIAVKIQFEQGNDILKHRCGMKIRAGRNRQEVE